jgi:hypothetical protein
MPVQHSVVDLPQSLDGLQVPELVLQQRVTSSDNTVVLQALVKWSRLSVSLATWEDLEPLKQRFPWD